MDDDQRLALAIRSPNDGRTAGLVIANHLRSRAPIVLRGTSAAGARRSADHDGVPALGQVGDHSSHEEDEAQIGRNYQARRASRSRARASWRYSEWLRREADHLGIRSSPPGRGRPCWSG
jgi:hypothetical protein